jgi:hypothetical protein
MKIINPLLFAASLIMADTALAQTDVNKDIDVAKVYVQVVKEGYGTPAIYLKLANEYYFHNNYTEAKLWYEKVFESEQPADKTILFRYKQSLKALKLNPEENPYLAVSAAN